MSETKSNHKDILEKLRKEAEKEVFNNQIEKQVKSKPDIFDIIFNVFSFCWWWWCVFLSFSPVFKYVEYCIGQSQEIKLAAFSVPIPFALMIYLLERNFHSHKN